VFKAIWEGDISAEWSLALMASWRYTNKLQIVKEWLEPGEEGEWLPCLRKDYSPFCIMEKDREMAIIKQ